MLAAVLAACVLAAAGTGTAGQLIAPHIRVHGCMLPNVTGLPFCDPALGIAARARDLRGRLTRAEKLCLMDRGACAVPRLGLPQYNWGVEDLHGAGIECLVDGAKTHCPTIFPTLNLLGGSFNDSLMQAVGKVIGTEMRAGNNAGARRGRHLPRPGEVNANPSIGVNGWGPNINIARDPRWGRNMEVPSEDSFLAGKVGAAMTRGIQGQGDRTVTNKYVLLLGALKHVTGYSLENWVDDTGGPRNGSKYNRMGFDANISRHDLAETYLEQYRIALTESEPLGMMCSYTAINGSASCENGHLLNTWARGSLGFKGNVVTDCGALMMSSEPRNYTPSSAAALNAGTDLNCGAVFDGGLGAAIDSGATTEAKLDASLERSMGLLMRAGYFDPVEMVPHSRIAPAEVGTAASHELAKDAALQGMVLLQNDKQALPLKKGVTTAVLGPLANITLGMMSRYYDAVCPGKLDPERGSWGKGMRPSGCITAPLHRLMARGKVAHASGYTCSDDKPNHHCLLETSQAGFAAAVAAAKVADQIVLFLGLDNTIEQEGMDRQTLGLPGAQPALLAAIRKAAPATPLTVLLLNGGAIAMEYGSADAVVEAFFPGIEGAEAIACALYGEAGCNRWGRLPVTVFPESFAAGNDMANMGVSTGGSGSRTYKYYVSEFGEPLFTFGHGLSYVPFALAWATPPPAAPSAISPTQTAAIAVAVANSGAREGDCVVMLYHCPSRAAVTVDPGMPVPNRRLVGYRRVSLAAGARATVTFNVTAEELALVDGNGDTKLFAGTHRLRVWHGSGRVDTLQHDFVVKQTAMLRALEW